MAMEYFDEKIVPILKKKLPGADLSGRLIGSTPGSVHVFLCRTHIRTNESSKEKPPKAALMGPSFAVRGRVFTSYLSFQHPGLFSLKNKSSFVAKKLRAENSESLFVDVCCHVTLSALAPTVNLSHVYSITMIGLSCSRTGCVSCDAFWLYRSRHLIIHT